MAKQSDLSKLNRNHYYSLNEAGVKLLMALNPAQANFAMYYLHGMEKIEAFMEAGYKAQSLDSKRSGVSNLLNNPSVAAFIKHVRVMQANKGIGSRQSIVNAYEDMLNGDVRDLADWRSEESPVFDREGNKVGVKSDFIITLKDSKTLDKHVANRVTKIRGGAAPSIEWSTHEHAREQLIKLQGYDRKPGSGVKQHEEVEDKRQAALDALYKRGLEGDNQAMLAWLKVTGETTDTDDIDDGELASLLRDEGSKR